MLDEKRGSGRASLAERVAKRLAQQRPAAEAAVAPSGDPILRSDPPLRRDPAVVEAPQPVTRPAAAIPERVQAAVEMPRPVSEPASPPSEPAPAAVEAVQAAPEAAPAEPVSAALPTAAPAPAATPATGTGRPRRPPQEIDLKRLQSEGYVTPSGGGGRLIEEYRIIKRQLLQMAFGRDPDAPPNGHVIMVTSTQPGEGKTFTALNLAMSLASERDLYVLLIDGDTQRQTLAQRLGISANTGLVDLLIEQGLDVGDALLRTNIPNLTFLPAGKNHVHTTELLASKQMANLMTDLAARYPDRVIIIDTPPVLASTEAAALSQYVGQTVVVVENGRTTHRALGRSLDLLQSCKFVSCVFNKSVAASPMEGYGY